MQNRAGIHHHPQVLSGKLNLCLAVPTVAPQENKTRTGRLISSLTVH